jgi:hypothetical protein
MSPSPPRRQPDGSSKQGDPRRVGRDQMRDADDGIMRSREPSDKDLRQPNERDASADGQPVRDVDPVVRQAEADLAAGRIDTEARRDSVPTFDRRAARDRARGTPRPRGERK